MRIARWNEARLHVIHVVDEAVMRDMQETMESLPLRARKDWNPESACDAARRGSTNGWIPLMRKRCG